MWHLFQNAVLTRDNMKKIKWSGSPRCSFCSNDESANHLFFECSVARVVWGVVGNILGTQYCPNNVWQSIVWFYTFLPGGDKLYMVAISAICWAIWKARNNVTFEEHKMRTPCEVLFHISSLIKYWSGLHNKEQETL